jgi:hypothetical protein
MACSNSELGIQFYNTSKKKSKAVPPHAMKALGEEEI